jgi:hypothetical protein
VGLAIVSCISIIHSCILTHTLTILTNTIL